MLCLGLAPSPPSPQLYSYPNRLGMIGEVAPSLPAPRTEGQVIMKPSELGVAHSTGRSLTSRRPAAPRPLPGKQRVREGEDRQDGLLLSRHEVLSGGFLALRVF